MQHASGPPTARSFPGHLLPFSRVERCNTASSLKLPAISPQKQGAMPNRLSTGGGVIVFNHLTSGVNPVSGTTCATRPDSPFHFQHVVHLLKPPASIHSNLASRVS